MRHRIEDLGRLLILLKNVLESPLFSENRCKDRDFPEWFSKQSTEGQEVILTNLVHDINQIEDKLIAMLDIAEGEDKLNRQ